MMLPFWPGYGILVQRGEQHGRHERQNFNGSSTAVRAAGLPQRIHAGHCSPVGHQCGQPDLSFPHKQDIATALAEQELKTIILPEEATLAALDGYLRRMLISLVDHARMFDDPLLFEDLPGQQQENAARIHRLQQNLERLFTQLRQQGIFRPELDGQTLQDVIDLIMFSHVGWQQRVSVSRQATDAAVDDMMRMQWLLLRPYLTEKGCAELEALAVK